MKETKVHLNFKVKCCISAAERHGEPPLLRPRAPHRDVVGFLQSHPLRVVQRGLQERVSEYREASSNFASSNFTARRLQDKADRLSALSVDLIFCRYTLETR